MNKLTKLFAIAVFSIWGSVAHADIKYGLGLMAGQVSTDGSETEGTAADTSTRSKSIEEIFVGADLYVESVADNPDEPPPITTTSGFDCENEIFGIAANANADSDVFKNRLLDIIFLL